jgi:hypothetical protein
VAREGFEPSKALGRQIYSLLHLTALQSRLSRQSNSVTRDTPGPRRVLTRLADPLEIPVVLIVWTEESASATRADLGAGEGI